MGPGGHQRFGVDRPDGAHDPLQELGLVLGAGAAGDEDARPAGAGPGRGAAPRPARLVEQRADVPVIPRERRRVEVEGPADRQEDAVGPVEIIERARDRRQSQAAPRGVEGRAALLHGRRDRVGGRRHRGALLGGPRGREAAGGGRHAGQRADADMRRQDRVRQVRRLGRQRAAQQQVEAQDGVGRNAPDLVERVGRVGAGRHEQRLAEPVGEVGEIGGVRIGADGGPAPSDEGKAGRLDLAAHHRIGHDAHAMPRPVQLPSGRQHGAEIARGSPRDTQDAERHLRGFPIGLRRSALFRDRSTIGFDIHGAKSRDDAEDLEHPHALLGKAIRFDRIEALKSVARAARSLPKRRISGRIWSSAARCC
ncbi:hypothetical protein MBRA_01876 [Methylobacterium brachiatum]|nr:hypothetical protein MBRA_01876 [Methylobacterium brachiatum]